MNDQSLFFFSSCRSDGGASPRRKRTAQKDRGGGTFNAKYATKGRGSIKSARRMRAFITKKEPKLLHISFAAGVRDVM